MDQIIKKLAFLMAVAGGAAALAACGNDGGTAIFANNGPVAYVYSADGYVQFGFFRGSALKDPRRLLEGEGKYVRHIKVRGRSEIDERAFAALLQQAARPR